MTLSTRYNQQETEEKWYKHWMSLNYFHSVPDDREPFTIVIPPPNVTGVLHMGHMLNNSIQDILIRKARLDGKNACWVPGTDHASIATEAKVVRWLREEKNLRTTLTNGKTNTAALSCNNYSAWAPPATGAVRLSPWTPATTPTCSAFLWICIKMTNYTADCAWSTGTPKPKPYCQMKR